MSNPLRIVAVIEAKPGHEAAVAAAVKACVGPSQAEPGCRSYELYPDESHPGRFVFLEEWVDAAAIAAHHQTPHFQALGAALGSIVAGPPRVCTLGSRLA